MHFLHLNSFECTKIRVSTFIPLILESYISDHLLSALLINLRSLLNCVVYDKKKTRKISPYTFYDTIVVDHLYLFKFLIFNQAWKDIPV